MEESQKSTSKGRLQILDELSHKWAKKDGHPNIKTFEDFVSFYNPDVCTILARMAMAEYSQQMRNIDRPSLPNLPKKIVETKQKVIITDSDDEINTHYLEKGWKVASVTPLAVSTGEDRSFQGDIVFVLEKKLTKGN